MRPLHFSRLVFGILFLSILCLPSKRSSAQQSEKATEAVQQLMNTTPIVGLSVAVVKKGKVIYNHSFGVKDLETKAPLTDNSLFRIASVSKSFTSTSLMQLVQQKKLSLDADVSDLIGFKIRNPKFPDRAITVRMLLSHTSSINDSQGYFELDDIDPSKNKDWKKCYNDYEPGTDYEYCNLNYNLAGVILEKVSGERFGHYIADHILKPLGIYGGFNVNDLDSNLFARIYDYNTETQSFDYSPSAYAPRKEQLANYSMGYTTFILSPAGGLKISAPGLANYMLMHMNNGKFNGSKIISSKSEKEMRKPLSDTEHYGLGLWTTQTLIDGETLVGHTGSAYGLYSAVFFEPKKKFGIVVITNGCPPASSNGFNAVIRQVNNILYDNLIKKN